MAWSADRSDEAADRLDGLGRLANRPDEAADRLDGLGRRANRPDEAATGPMEH